MKILQKTESPLLSRTQVIASLDHTGKPTPSEIEITKKLVEQLKVKEEVIRIKKIKSKYGLGKSRIIAHIYKTKKDLDEVEPKSKKKQDKKEESKENGKSEIKKEEANKEQSSK